MKLAVCLLSVLVTGSFAYPVSQPVYPNTQYITAQAIPATSIQYRQQPQAYLQQQQQQPTYISAAAVNAAAAPTARPTYEPDKSAGLQKYSTQIKQPIQQVLLPTTVDRQVQRIAQSGGPLYLQQVQLAQQQGQVQQAIDAAQRKLTSQTLGRQIQPIPIALPTPQQPQPQYLRALPQQTQVKYVSPAAPGYRPDIRAQTEQEAKDQQEDYDPNPSYQFGFDVNDDLYTNYQNRKEQREGNKITGSYSVVDSDGFVRTVTYTADPKEGFKAEVTRQPTDIVVKIPKPDPQFQRQTQQYVQAVPAQQKGEVEAQRSNVIQYQYQ